MLKQWRMKIIASGFEIGGVYKNKAGEEYGVVKYSDGRTKSGNKMVTIKFLDNGYEYDIDPVQITRGHVKNRFSKTIYGAGV